MSRRIFWFVVSLPLAIAVTGPASGAPTPSRAIAGAVRATSLSVSDGAGAAVLALAGYPSAAEIVVRIPDCSKGPC